MTTITFRSVPDGRGGDRLVQSMPRFSEPRWHSLSSLQRAEVVFMYRQLGAPWEWIASRLGTSFSKVRKAEDLAFSERCQAMDPDGIIGVGAQWRRE